MSHEIDCPVCKHPNVKGDVCPNCETDLSLIRTLIELPTVTVNSYQVNSSKDKPIARWLLSGLILMLFLLVAGFQLGFQLPWSFLSINRGSIYAPVEVSQSSSLSPDFGDSSSAESKSVEKIVLPSPKCEGFSYSVQPGESLTRISQKFYGNKNYELIITSNPNLRNRESKLEIGETLCIVNP